MNRRAVLIGIVATIALQFAVLSGMVVRAALPLWTGTEVRVETIPVDPRSMFRGNYARLNYAFSTLPGDALDFESVRMGEALYVRLEPLDSGIYAYAGAALEKPADGIFLRGRVKAFEGRQHSADLSYRVEFGIEAFFAPKQEALELEERLRDGGVAVLMVAASGRAALKDVIPAGERLP